MSRNRRDVLKCIGTVGVAGLGGAAAVSGSAAAFSMDERVEVTAESGLNTRRRPGVESNVVATLPRGTVGEIVNGPTTEDGYTWWGVHWLDDDVWGWSVERYLASTGSGGGKPGVDWVPAHGGNYASASRGADSIDWVIIHTVQGSASSAVNYFQDPDANVSAHYTVAEDGYEYQSVGDANIAYHAGGQNYNTWSIGIEHGGYVSGTYEDAQYRASAELTSWLCDQYGVPKQHPSGVAPCDAANPANGGVIGHHQVPEADCGPNNHTDPGSNWNWSYYMDLVRSY